MPLTMVKLSITMRIEGSSKESPGSEVKTSLSYTADKPTQHMQGAGNSYPIAEQAGGNLGTDASVPVEGSIQQKKAAKIHDFCFGIPFGGLVLSWGLVGFLFSRNPTTLTTGVLFGGALLALSIYSLKVWRQGKSSLPFILGQSALTAALLAKHFQTYSLTKKVFPTGFYAVVSAAMLCFFTYVMLSGGNPPPKKSKLATSPP
ncbi:protein FATTY ACID EXPORT 1, chloroplastic isoform X2 [Magnolia sinica]|uniref:protein FATTY ACID EXPORT 1, chloroplastic isoform X2 n=1 Tax=Magnolia sinica TaxID=86752 RepID=UPI002657B7A6|nr:protein FATTY ACID EXPORT 1, chloroplastic isoform X2 [Magnolia sinica]